MHVCVYALRPRLVAVSDQGAVPSDAGIVDECVWWAVAEDRPPRVIYHCLAVRPVHLLTGYRGRRSSGPFRFASMIARRTVGEEHAKAVRRQRLNNSASNPARTA